MGNRLTPPLITKIQNHYDYSLRPTLNCGNRGFFLVGIEKLISITF